MRATLGLDRDSVGRVSMRVNEGLVGLAIELGQPVVVEDAISHPRYKYFPETGEERYHTFLGVPIQEGRHKPLGVLVAQTLRRRKFSKDEVRLLRTAASQVAQILSHFQLRETAGHDARCRAGKNSPPAPGRPSGRTGIRPRSRARRWHFSEYDRSQSARP